MKSILVMMSMVFSLSTFAVYDPTYERPLKALNDLAIVNSHNADDIVGADLTVHRRDSASKKTYTALSLNLHTVSGEDQNIMVPVTEVSDSCGSVTYYASLSSNGGMGGRVHISFTDHSKRKCKDLRPYRYVVNFTRGFGWCGTMDERIEFGSNEDFEPVYSIM